MKMRIIHRYLGFFLAGIMAIYALSGIVLIFRETDFLKSEQTIEKKIAPNLEANQLGREVRNRNLKITKEENGILYFQNGQYNKETGEVKFTKKDLPYVLKQMTRLHKANTESPIFWLNIIFGVSLLFFVISSFWMFFPGSDIFKKGMYFTAAGIILALVLLFV
ncbi:MAG: PepSY domain-containing protein [Crocinitomicaceae bacterium]|nr:PepSY domain-containing protein [Crocinitomicaceae bacterium]